MLAFHVYTKEGNKDEKGKLKSTFNVKVDFYKNLCLPVISLWEALQSVVGTIMSQVRPSTFT